MKTERTELNRIQINRLEPLAEIENIDSAALLVTGDTKSFVIKTNGKTTTIYLSDEDLDIVMNGIKLERTSK